MFTLHRLIPLLPLALGACVLPGDLERISDDLGALGLVVEDRESSMAEIGESVDTLGATVDQVIEDANARADGFISAGEAAGGGSIALALAFAALNRYRDSRRRKRGEPVGDSREGSNA